MGWGEAHGPGYDPKERWERAHDFATLRGATAIEAREFADAVGGDGGAKSIGYCWYEWKRGTE